MNRYLVIGHLSLVIGKKVVRGEAADGEASSQALAASWCVVRGACMNCELRIANCELVTVPLVPLSPYPKRP